MVDGSVVSLFEQFVFREAQLMDEHSYDDWLSLWDKDSLYWVPCNEKDVDPDTEVSLIYERYGQIEERILRLKSKFAHTQSPKTRLLRVVSNVHVEQASESEITGSSVFALGAVRVNQQLSWFGRSHHTLVHTDEGLKIKQKKVFVLNNDAPMHNMTFLI